MADLHTLIKMQKLYVDEQRRVLAEKQRAAEAITMAIATLQANLEMEKIKAAEGGEGSAMIGAFIKKELAREKQLQRDLSIKEKEVEKEHHKLVALFEEFKRYEIAQENWDKEQLAEELRRENAEYDERAGQRHGKKEN